MLKRALLQAIDHHSEVPPVLLSGHHAEIAKWRRREALARTLARRPDLLEDAQLDETDRRLLQDLLEQREKGVV